MEPSQGGRDIYQVLEDLGRLGRVWRETAEDDANLETLIRDLLDDQYSRPTCIVAFNTAEGWSRDVTNDIADELRRRFVECAITCRFPWRSFWIWQGAEGCRKFIPVSQ